MSPTSNLLGVAFPSKAVRKHHSIQSEGMRNAVDSEIQHFYNYRTMKKRMVICALGALAQETRLDIFRLLVQRGPEGMAAGEIGARLGQPSPTMSFHLNQLRFAGLIISRRESRSIIYSANYKAMNELLGYLTENCCGGRPEVCSPVVSAGCGTECEPRQTGAAKTKSRRISL